MSSKFTGFDDKQLLSKIKSYLDTASADTVELSTGFFRSLDCKANCGACCKPVSLEFLKDSQRWDKFKLNYEEHVTKFSEHVDPSGEIVMSYSNTDHKERYCSFLNREDGRCTIHKSAPLPCRIAPLKFIDKRVSSNKTYLNASAYGRAWAFTRLDGNKGAICEVKDFDYDKFLNDLEMLRELRTYAIKLGVKTKLKYIVEFLEKNSLEFKEGLIPSQNILFTEENTF